MRIKLRRLLTAPRTRIESVDGETTRLRVDGLVCDSVCAVRTRRAIEAIDGVRGASVDFDTGIVTVEGTPAGADAYEHALRGAVGGMRLRRLIEIVATRLRRSSEKATA